MLHVVYLNCLRGKSGLVKRLAIVAIGMVITISLVAAGCAETEPAAGIVLEDGTVVSSCVGCHTDKNLLKEVASVSEESVSEETSGEG